jgi:hypothetical protein
MVGTEGVVARALTERLSRRAAKDEVSRRKEGMTGTGDQ